jgi:SAM-dependent methyltransferase
MESAYVERYADLYRRHWWWRAREEFLLAELRRLAPPRGFGPILDVGCGAGLSFDVLARFGAPEGVESEAEAVAAAGRWRDKIHLGILSDLPPSPRFGLITALDVIEHIEDDEAVLVQAAELLAPAGLLLITVPALPELWTEHDAINHHYRRYRRAELGAKLARVPGLAVLDLRYFFAWTVPAKLLVRAKERWLGKAADPLPGVPIAPINQLLIQASRLEQRLLRRPPIGSSLLAVARRRA